MLIIMILLSECRLWKACLTTVWHNFQANICSKKSSARLLWVYWSKGCSGGSSQEFWEKFNLAVVRRSESRIKRKERGIVVASPLLSIISDYYQWSIDILFSLKNRKLSATFLSRAPRSFSRARELADVFEKAKRKRKQRLRTGYNILNSVTCHATPR